MITSQNLRLLISSLGRSSVDLMLAANSSNNIQEGNPLIQLCDKKSSIFHHQDPFLCGNHSSLRTMHTQASMYICIYPPFSYVLWNLFICHILWPSFSILPLPRDICTHLLYLGLDTRIMAPGVSGGRTESFPLPIGWWSLGVSLGLLFFLEWWQCCRI